MGCHTMDYVVFLLFTFYGGYFVVFVLTVLCWMVRPQPVLLGVRPIHLLTFTSAYALPMLRGHGLLRGAGLSALCA